MRTADVVVVGSGPGGAVTAEVLAKAGMKVLVVEEGARPDHGTVRQYSLDDMAAHYRNAGLTAALGLPTVAYTEGRVVGGGSEVNSGLYHRPGAELLSEWSRVFSIEGLDVPVLEPHMRGVEDRLCVGTSDHGPGVSSEPLLTGAAALGWRTVDVPRAVQRSGSTAGRRQTMSRTYLPEAEAHGAEVLEHARVLSITRQGARATGVELVRRIDDREVRESIRADAVIVCGGAIQTPALLQRSGWWRNVGGNLSVHPTAKIVAEFGHEANTSNEVASVQVREFGPWLTLGGSASSPAMIAMALSENWKAFGGALVRWPHQLVHYAAIQSTGRGRVTAVPGRRDPAVTYRLTREDGRRLHSGLVRLMHLLLAGGATRLFPVFPGATEISGVHDVEIASRAFRLAQASLMTVHLAGTVPMGEDRRRSATDSFGALHGAHRVWVNDASLLPWAPGINPQGTVMAIAHRNAAQFLANHGAST